MKVVKYKEGRRQLLKIKIRRKIKTIDTALSIFYVFYNNHEEFLMLHVFHFLYSNILGKNEKIFEEEENHN